MNEEEYSRLTKMLTVRACRVLGVATSSGGSGIVADRGMSPADYAADTLKLWTTGKLRFTGSPEAVPAFLLKVVENKCLSALRKPEMRASKTGNITLADESIEDPSPGTQPETLFELRSLLRDAAFREALNQCVADDKDLLEYVEAIEVLAEDTIPAPRDIAALLGVSETEIYNRRRKLARDLGSMASPDRAGGASYEKEERGDPPSGIVGAKPGSALWHRDRPDRRRTRRRIEGIWDRSHGVESRRLQTTLGPRQVQLPDDR